MDCPQPLRAAARQGGRGSQGCARAVLDTVREPAGSMQGTGRGELRVEKGRSGSRPGEDAAGAGLPGFGIPRAVGTGARRPPCRPALCQAGPQQPVAAISPGDSQPPPRRR
jgi:hypothetical protein